MVQFVRVRLRLCKFNVDDTESVCVRAYVKYVCVCASVCLSVSVCVCPSQAIPRKLLKN